MSQTPDDLAASIAIDPENPWLGLSSYTEETRAYFHGRDEEAAELARRVQRKNLTVLFGQSGLGKTSLLRAGLVPRLRGEGFCPVYVRVDYNPESPSPSEQIKQAIFRATAEAGHWSRPGTAIEGESLWEFLHHRGDLLRDASGRTLLPLLIFDQFEEIFTLAQADDAGRLRAREFLADLADLVENRPPAALEARLDVDEAAAEDFDFARADYRILIALREDYLAHLESVKGTMPSITQNRMRLARMTGTQALAAVMQPGGRLVSQEVAESIVRFVAGGTELANAEVEPSLLSLICRELNNVRLAQKRQEISADLLAGSRDTILTEFYERALADQPEGVRRVIEDELLTESGYRESLAEERVTKALAAVGAAPDALAKLVNRRLLRIEERLDMRRVELTHDVLCTVVAGSRDKRHEREARDEAERQLARQQEREAATRQALVRARTIATVCAVLMVVAAAGAVFGWVNYRRAKVADAEAQQARGDAEKLVGFLIEDFYAELEPTGRLETINKLAQQTVGYFDKLPPRLVTSQTQIYRGMALIRGGGVLLAGDDIEGGNRNIAEAQELFKKLLASGDRSEAVAYGRALSLFMPFSVWGTQGGPNSKPTDLLEAADLLRPFIGAPGTPKQLTITYADILNHLSHREGGEKGIALCDEARALLTQLGAVDLTDLNAASVYADTADSEARHALLLGRLEESERLEHEVYDIAEKVLAKRPGDLRSMKNRALAAGLLGEIAILRHDDAAAARYAAQAAEAGEDAVRFNPADLGTWQYWVMGRNQVAMFMYQRGDVADAIEEARATLTLASDDRLPSSLQPILEDTWYRLAWLQAAMGRVAEAERYFAGGTKASEESAKQFPESNPSHALQLIRVPTSKARVQLNLGDAKGALAQASAAAGNLEKMSIAADNPSARLRRDLTLAWTLGTVTEAALRLGRDADAEVAARRRLELPLSVLSSPVADKARRQALLALAIAKQGRGAEAQGILAPALEYYARERKGGAGGTTFRLEYAEALYASALAQGDDPAGRAARQRDLAAGAELLASASPEVRQLSPARELAARIAAARAPASS